MTTSEDEMELPRSPDSPGRARSFVADVLDGNAAEKAALAVSELVTNALLHTEGAISLRHRPADGFVRFEVIDESGEPPRIQRAGPDDVRGRGLAIVDQVSDRWGTASRSDGRSGKVVWFDVAHRTASATVRTDEVWRAVECLVSVPAPLEFRVAIEPHHVVVSEHDPDDEWWSTVEIPRTDRGPTDSPVIAVTVPRMVTRKIVGLESLNVAEGPTCPIEVADGVSLQLGSQTIAASAVSPHIPPPPVVDRDAVIEQVTIPRDAPRGHDPCVLAVGAGGGRGTVEIAGQSWERLNAREIGRSSLVESDDGYFLAGATHDPPPRTVFLVTRAHEVDLRTSP